MLAKNLTCPLNVKCILIKQSGHMQSKVGNPSEEEREEICDEICKEMSPTVEFELFKGLKQGDSLSLFLFILVMEGLHALTCKAKGATFGHENMSISHLMYVDDIIFFGEWSSTNAHNLICMLRCFFLITGLKINVHKSNVLGVCVPNEEVSNMAKVIGYGVTKLPFKYLGVLVGCNMASRKLESCIGSNAGLTWGSCLNGFGGLSNWGAILTSVHNLKLKGPDLLSFCSRKIRNGASTRFWDDIWIGDQSLKSKFPRIFLLDNDQTAKAFQGAIGNVVLTYQRDSWQWSLDVTHGFSVVSVCSLVYARTLDVDSNATRWIHFIPIKINVFLWRLSVNKLPSRVNLDLKGTYVGSLLCPICHVDAESVNHIFFSCEKAKALWYLFAKWWELDIPFCDNISDWFTWLDSLKVSNKVRSFIERVGGRLCGLYETIVIAWFSLLPLQRRRCFWD
ncbi:RNA-directed DNA polymerase, eukaryota, reverse transcriptase zinc-binding domain protein [Tanacetum coccineum]